MFDTINGAPVHPLVVHVIVVLLPLAALGTFAIVAVRRWRVPYGPLVVAASLVATVLMPVATSSGESLEEKVGDPGRHAELGDQLIWFSLPLLVLLSALVWLEWRSARATAGHAATPSANRTVLNAVAGLAVVAALAVTYQVIRVGDSGAKAVWGSAAVHAIR